ncbi:hypothetical protein BDF20DRAFT_441953 [Mycotypha africana]|uniref:uncharacterized protein n=1 Tax=Mycotypha africana TaxID=64632 RepID=UPI0023014719|nr:uncharacterized protein BDF20DRAFT_441953 [Mycotypha africana]KAI8981940.1 hypothetical protein BDF20DRAFT_441953 [Mycotypha africana]
MSNTVVDGKDTIKFVDEEDVRQTADTATAPDTNEHEDKKSEGEEEGQSAAFNPETGEINWDCPCLGGMAQGPCGEEFKAAFSCFVYSDEEPKGINCVEYFKTMQDCFRKHPDVYGDEIDDDDDDDDEREKSDKSNDNETTTTTTSTTTTSVSTTEEKAEDTTVASSMFEEENEAAESKTSSFSSWLSSWF